MFAFNTYMFSILIVVLIHKARCRVSNPSLKYVRDVDSGFKFESVVDLNDHNIDLNHYKDPLNTCLNHHRQQNKPYSSGLKYSLKIMPYNKSGCFVLYNEYNCQGARLKFHNVGRERVLQLDPHEVDHYPEEKLLNFDVRPRSISACPLLPESGLWGDYSLRITKTGNAITNECLNVDRSDFTGDSFFAFFLDKSPAHFFDNRIDHGHSPVCIETYSKYGCTGDMIEYIIAEPMTKSDLDLFESFMIWHVYNPYDPKSIDTDIMSVRKCPITSSTPTPTPTTTTPEPTTSAQLPTSPFPSSPPATTTFQSEGMDNENYDSSFEGNKFCQFPDCQTIDKFIKAGTENITNCFFVIFNESNCNGNPTFHHQSINRVELLQLTFQYEGFSNWTISDCHDKKEQIQPCLASLKTSEKLEDVLTKMLKTRHSSKWERGGNGESEHSGLIILIIIGAVGFIVLAVVVILSVLYWRNQKRIQAAARRSNRNRIGLKRRVVSSLPAGASGGRGIHHQIDPIGTSVYVNDITGLQALSRFFEKGGLEIPRENINIGNIRDSSAQIIGVGEFSIAFKGILNPEEKIVAVKTMKSGHATTSALKSVLKECRIFVECGKHENIVEFLGVCTERIRSGEIFVVMGYCENGPLKSFLVQHRSHFMSLVKDGELVESEHLKAYAERPIEGGPPTKFNTFQLLRWCLEIADAMEFLTTNKIVHVSLCSKNVMLDTDFKAKLCDFHLARYSAESSYVNRASRLNMNKERNIPWRFYAVESLLDDIFSTKSDVWTFGIFMWEVWTLGATPYPEYSYGGEFTMVLKHGYRLLKPELTTIQCYELMIICWYDDPEKRPTFSKLKARLERMIYSRQEEVHSIAQE